MAVFGVLIVFVTIWLMGAISAQAESYAGQLQAGELTAGAVYGVAGGMKTVWLVCLGGFALFAAGTSCLALRVHKRVQQRVDHLIEFAERRAEVSSFHSQLQRALDLADTQLAALDVCDRALEETVPGLGHEVLLADSSVAHLRRVSSATGVEMPGCGVEHPFECAAVRRGQTLTFDSSERLDACPRLRGRDCGPLGAVCSPLNVMGRTIGVLHIATGENEVPDPEAVSLIDGIANQTSSRLGMIRTLATTQLQAQTDPLTGLLNRRSFEDAAAEVLRAGPSQTHAVAVCDLDHFKRLNDTAGHEAGDRALKLFADVMRSSVRPTDLVGRHGGEEFVVLLRDVDGETARTTLERLRNELRRAVRRSAGPAFTTSIGAAQFMRDGSTIPDLIGLADRALYAAKEQGRDRTVFSSDLTIDSTVTDAVAS